jgi:hypothetical protein
VCVDAPIPSPHLALLDLAAVSHPDELHIYFDFFLYYEIT